KGTRTPTPRRVLTPGSPTFGPSFAREAATLELSSELKNRKKLDPTSIARPAASASSIALDEVMPRLPSAVGQSLSNRIRTSRTSHQIGPLLTRELSTT